MNLIDLYVNEVGRNLPMKMREDIEKEIRSLVEDMLEDEAKAQGRQPDEQMIVDVLKKMGSPEKVAASYLPPRYLIGPKYFPTFLLVTRIVLTVIFIIGAIGLGVQLGQTNPSGSAFLSALATGFASIIGSMIGAFGNVVLVFAILQWLLPEPKIDQKEWDPRKLKAEPDPERVRPVGQVAEIAGNIILLLLLNVYPQWLTLISYSDGVWVHVRVLTDAFFSYVPWMSLLLVGGIALNSYLLRQGGWNTPARLTSIGLHLASIVMLGAMLSGPALAALNAADLAQTGWLDAAVGSIGAVNNALNLAMRIALGITLVMQVIEMAKMLVRLIGSRVSLPAGLTR